MNNSKLPDNLFENERCIFQVVVNKKGHFAKVVGCQLMGNGHVYLRLKDGFGFFKVSLEEFKVNWDIYYGTQTSVSC